MNKKPSIGYFRTKGLLPYQAQFASAFIEDETEPYQELVAPVGMGKIRLASAIITFELEEALNKHVLVITPAVLLGQWQFELSSQLSSDSIDVRPLLVDRKTFFDLELKAAEGESIWPASAIILMSMDLARRKDVAPKLTDTEWDLVIVDESHLLTRKLDMLFRELKNSGRVRRALLLTASTPYLRGNAVKTIQLRDIVDWDGHSLFVHFERELRPVYYHRAKEERDFINELSDFARMIGEKLPFGKFQETSILRTASSSIYTVENSLRRLQDAVQLTRNKIAHGMPLATEDIKRIPQELELIADDLGEIDEPQEIVDIKISAIQENDYVTMYNKLDSLLDQVSEIHYDSKLEALIAYLKQCSVTSTKKHFCIWTTFKSTAHYIASNLQEITEKVWLLTGELDVRERFNRVSSFDEQGGILITTDAALMGTDLGYVNECINYDLPLNTKSLEQRWGRFLRFGRTGPFEMVVLVDATKSFMWEENLLQTFQDFMSQS